MDAFAQLGHLFSSPTGGANWGNILKAGVTGMGLIGDIMAQRKQNAALNRIAFYQKNPAAAAAEVRSLTAPLSMGLTENVGNQVQGYLAERGLSQSPNITAATLGEALAPYQQQNQQQALQEFYSLLNPAGATYAAPSNMGDLLKLWFPATATPSHATVGPWKVWGTGGAGTPTFPNLPNTSAGVPPDISSLPGIDIWDTYTPPPPPTGA